MAFLHNSINQDNGHSTQRSLTATIGFVGQMYLKHGIRLDQQEHQHNENDGHKGCNDDKLNPFETIESRPKLLFPIQNTVGGHK